MAAVGQRVVYRLATSDYRTARVTKIVSGTTVNLVAFATGTDWYTGVPGDITSMYFADVAQGTAVNQWQEESAIDPAVQVAIDECCTLPGAGSTVSLATNTPRQPSATRPVRVTASGSWSWSLSAIGTVAGTLAIHSDSSSSPTTPRAHAPCSRSVTVGVVVGDAGSLPWCLEYVVPAGHYYQLATSGSGTWGDLLVTEQVL